ncbi:20222_t:CDS:2 [Funneliformis geosporum]|nr:20222_t:CDS:2 [Funneliformis geosporum]
MNNKIPQQGEIWLADFNCQKVKEASKTYPVLILSNNLQNKTSRYVVVAPLTSDAEKVKYVASFEVLIVVNKKNGLETKSKVLLHRLLAVEKNLRLIERKGKLNGGGQTWVARYGHKWDSKEVSLVIEQFDYVNELGDYIYDLVSPHLEYGEIVAFPGETEEVLTE